MKLVQNVAFAAMTVVALFGLEGCASHTSAQAAAPKPIVATTQIMAAEITDSDNAPHVGKSHRSASTNALVEANASASEDGEKAPARDDRKHHNGGGFSGWK